MGDTDARNYQLISIYTGFAKVEQHYNGFIVVVAKQKRRFRPLILTLPLLRAPISTSLGCHKE